MWELPIYLVVAPLLTLVISLVSTIKFKNYFIAPVSLLILFNIPTVILPMLYNIGWGAIFGWAFLYTVISMVISFIVWGVRRKDDFPKSA